MEKTFSKIEIGVIKTTAKNVAPYAAKKQKVENQIKEVEEKVAEAIRKRAAEKIEKLTAEKDYFQTIIDSLNTPVKQITGGFTTEDLIEVRKEPTGSLDPKTNKEILKTVYALKYPETIIPPSTEGMAGSDYDIDSTPADLAPAEDHGEAAPEEAGEGDPFGNADEDPFGVQ